jgi:hypothetical protein
MKDLMKQLKEKYDGKRVIDIEKSAHLIQTAVYDGQKRFYEMLYYLNHTKRFRENDQYKKAPWSIYIRDVFKMSEQTYWNMTTAIFRFPKESEALGPGLVSNVRQKCGVEKAVSVLGKIMKIKNRTHPKIEKIIEANLRPAQQEKAKKAPYAVIERENAKLKDENRALMLKNTELQKQIVRLKKTAGTVNAIRDILHVPVIVPKPGGNVMAPV